MIQFVVELQHLLWRYRPIRPDPQALMQLPQVEVALGSALFLLLFSRLLASLNACLHGPSVTSSDCWSDVPYLLSRLQTSLYTTQKRCRTTSITSISFGLHSQFYSLIVMSFLQERGFQDQFLAIRYYRPFASCYKTSLHAMFRQSLQMA